MLSKHGRPLNDSSGMLRLGEGGRNALGAQHGRADVNARLSFFFLLCLTSLPPQFPETCDESASPFVFVCAGPQELLVKFPIKGRHQICKSHSFHLAGSRVD